MESLKLRSFFMLTVFTAFSAVVLLSGLTIWGCIAFRHYLLPDSNSAYLTVTETFPDGSVTTSSHLLRFGAEEATLPKIIMEYDDGKPLESNLLDAKFSIRKIESSYDTLTPKRKLAYQLCGAAMVAVPTFLSITGILFCGFYFYRKKLSEPLRLLSEAMAQIAAQNLDFSLVYPCEDEMGLLCRSFEQMRNTLAENNKSMWELLERQKLMQASIAHDLRNPIAIIKGYTEYLQINLPTQKVSSEKLDRIINNLDMAAKRLEQYVESVRTLNQLEDMKINCIEMSASALLEDIREDFCLMASHAGISLALNSRLPECTLRVDNTVVYRILENVFSNALRFAKSSVSIGFALEEHRLYIDVADDGSGFPDEVLKKKEKLFLPTQLEDGHLGMGLTISRLLCEKHGGSLKFHNDSNGGAVVKIILEV